MADSKRGGRRPGAGRKPGSKGKATLLREAIARGVVVGDLQPLDLMLAAMRDAYAKGDLHLAFQYAEKCAPFCHSKLQSMTATVSVRRAEQMTTEELERELREMGIDVASIAGVVEGNDTEH